MSGFGPAGGGQNPFEGIFSDLARLLGSSSGPLNWDVARQVTVLIAGDGMSEPNVDPADRIRLEELARVAELHVVRATGLSFDVRHVEALTHVEWAQRSLEAWRPLLEALATSLRQGPDENTEPSDMAESSDQASQFAHIERWITPVMFGMQAGGMVGHLAKRSLGQFDLPVPRNSTDTLVLVPANIAAFAKDWSLPLDELSLYVSIEETLRTAILSRAHVRQRLEELLMEYVSGFQPETGALEERLGELDVNDPASLPSALNDPQALLGAIQSPAQQQTLLRLGAIVAALVGYVDYMVATVTPAIVSSASAIAEAVKRRRVEETDGQRLVERLLGMEMSQPTFDRGNAFVSGIIERAGEDGLARLWRSAYELPTPAEIDAPGLWLERIDIPTGG